MNWKQAEQSWRHIDMHARSTWPKLSDDELADIAGNREALVENCASTTASSSRKQHAKPMPGSRVSA